MTKMGHTQIVVTISALDLFKRRGKRGTNCSKLAELQAWNMLVKDLCPFTDNRIVRNHIFLGTCHQGNFLESIKALKVYVANVNNKMRHIKNLENFEFKYIH